MRCNEENDIEVATSAPSAPTSTSSQDTANGGGTSVGKPAKDRQYMCERDRSSDFQVTTPPIYNLGTSSKVFHIQQSIRPIIRRPCNLSPGECNYEDSCVTRSCLWRVIRAISTTKLSTMSHVKIMICMLKKYAV